MCEERVVNLQQALLAVLASAEQLGVDMEVRRQQAISGLMRDVPWPWVIADDAAGAVYEIKAAIHIIKVV